MFMRSLQSTFSATAVAALLLALAGCGTSETVSSSEGSAADQAAVLQAVDESPFFGTALTDTDEDAEAAALAVPAALSDVQPLAAEGGTAVPPLHWWRGHIVNLGRDVDIHIENQTASVTVVHDFSGTLFMADRVGEALVLKTKPFEDRATRHALFTRTFRGWDLSAISPVEFALAGTAVQSVFVTRVQASVGGTVVWETDDPAALYSVPAQVPTFTPDDVIRVEAAISNAPSAWSPSEFVFLHRPGHMLDGRRTRDRMFDDGTNGDLAAGDGVYTRTYVIGPCLGRHFAAVDVIDAATFADDEAPYNSGAWGMPYMVK